MQTTPHPDDEPLLELLKAKLDALIARQPEISDPQELARLSHQYQAVINALIALGYDQPFDVEDELLFVPKPDYDLFSNVDFSAQNLPDVQFQRQILSVLMHEVRTPIAVIHVSADLITRLGELNEKQKTRLTQIDDQVNRIERLVDQLAASGFAKLEALNKAPDEKPKD